MRSPWNLSAPLLGAAATIALVQPVAQALTSPEIGRIALAVTVRIETPGEPGSGVIIERNGNIYTVLTAQHVLAALGGNEEAYVIPAADETKSYRLNNRSIRTLPQNLDVDLAIVQFESQETYEVARLGDSSTLSLGSESYVSGYPLPTAAIKDITLQFTDGIITAIPTEPYERGYGLVYSNNTIAGMSGGPVFDAQGNVIGIHGRGDRSGADGTGQKTGFNLAIPINTFRRWNQPNFSPQPIARPTTPPAPPTPPPAPPTTSSTKPTFLGLPVEPYSYTSARVSANGTVTPYTAQSPLGKYTETALRLPANAVPLDMVAIPGGTFTMGSPESEAKRFSDEGPQHRVTVPDFFMGRYEVTQAQYEAVMGSNPANFQGRNNPVEGVSWDDAQEFIRRLNRITGKTYRLPTEAEWEYAARAGTTTPFSYGETITPEVVNYDGNYPYGRAPKGEYRERTIEVNSLYPNPWGLYHIHGNVWEWCADQWYEWYDSYSNKPNQLKQDGSITWTQANTNILPSNADYYLLRGGSWYDVAWLTRSAYRDWNWRDFGPDDWGFRLVFSGRTP